MTTRLMAVCFGTVVLVGIAVAACTATSAKERNAGADTKLSYTCQGNPYLPLWEHMPDGEPRVFEDPDNPGQYRIYVIGSHDVKYDGYCGLDIHQWSASVDDLSTWRDEGPIFSYSIDGEWDVMYAPDLVELPTPDGGKVYYLYPHSRGPQREAMVAKGDRPDGPFTPVNLTEDGHQTLEGSCLGFDPSVFIELVTDPSDPDAARGYRAYGYWGYQCANAAELDPETMYSVRPGTEVKRFFIPASNSYGDIRDPEGTTYPCVAEGEDLKAFNFYEASSLRKVGNKYVSIYSGFSGPDYGMGSSNSTLRYAYADTPLGPWKTGGVLVDSRAPVLNEDGSAIVCSNFGHNTHGSIEQINGQWYVFYHRPPRNFGFARQATVAPISVEYDEAPVAEGGAVRITGFDPFNAGSKNTVKATNGTEYKGAEVTSEGFYLFGLPPYNYYSAGYACYFSNPDVLQDSWDIWANHMPVSGLKSGDVIGFKYFGFGGLDNPKCGLKSFEGTAPGNETEFNLFLTSLTNKPFDVEVWLDAPWDNTAWDGKKIGEINVPAKASQLPRRYTLNVADAVDRLEGKHAIYLRVKADDNEAPLCAVEGLGFSKKGSPLERPIVPTVSINADGKAIDLPTVPTRANSHNGLLGYDIYDARVVKAPNASSYPKLSATASLPNVKIDIRQPSKENPVGIVRCNYNGAVKTYRIKIDNK